MATIYDVAKRARVSTYTVSAVLNRSAYVSPELTERVKKAVQELDYTINELARSLQTRRSRTVGMLIPDIANPFYAKAVRGVEDRLKREGYSLILGNTYNSVAEQNRYLALFRAKQMDGMLLFIAAGEELEARRAVENKRPAVFLGRVPHTFKADSVTADNVRGAKQATEYLVRSGHRRIGILCGEMAVSAGSDRVDGWRRALKRHKLPAPDDLVGEGGWVEEGACEITHRLLDLPERPTAILSANFLMLAGILRALKDRKLRCPDQVEVMSWDDSEWLDVFEPPISTVVTPSYELGKTGAELLLKRMKSPGRKIEQILLPTALHIRRPSPV